MEGGYLDVPQFDGPVKRRRDEVWRKVNLTRHWVAVDTCHWTLMTLEYLANAGLAARD